MSRLATYSEKRIAVDWSMGKIFMKLEVHVHTKKSKDSLMPFWLLYLKCRVQNIKWIAITEHNNIDGGIEFKKFCKKHGDHIRVIVGEEIFTNKGEIIGLYLTESIQPGLSPEETITQIKAQHGVVYVPHPYDEMRKKTVLEESEINKYQADIDCIEIHNGRNISDRYGEIQQNMSKKYNIRPIVGSDAHTIWEIGRNYLLVENEYDLCDKEKFLQAIEEASIKKKKCIKFAHKLTKIDKAIKMISEGRLNEVCHIINKRHRGNEHRV